MKAYTRFLNTEVEAQALCRMKNRACRRANNYKDIYTVIDGPEDNYAVVDLDAAITMGNGYEICEY
jgi:hypothetical protein